LKKRTHITLIGLNFFPENTAIGLYSTQLAQYLEMHDIKLDIITAFPYYPQWKIASEYQDKPSYLKEELGTINLYRYKQYVPGKPTFLKRIIHILSFTWGSFWNLWKIKNCDIVISIVPFTSSTLLGYVQKKRFNAKSWIHIQDFEFDAAFQSGLTKSGEQKGGLVYRFLMQLEKSLFSRADRVSTISHMMLEKLKKKTTASTYFLPNWIDEKQINPAFAKAVGDGAKRTWLEEEIKSYSGITLYPPVPYEDLSDLLCSADVHILFQKPEVVDTVMPSKILGMMASAKPSIITGHKQSEVAQAMTISEGGYYSSEKGIETVLKQLNTLVNDAILTQEMGKKARKYVTSNFAKDQILSTFLQELTQL